MKIHAEYAVTEFHYEEDRGLVVDTATLVTVNLCHDDCPDVFSEKIVRKSEFVIEDHWMLKDEDDTKEEPVDETPEPTNVYGRPGPIGRVH